MSKVRMAVVGLRHGLGHVGVILKQPRAELAAVCDTDATLVEDVRQLRPWAPLAPAGGVRGFRDYAELLKWGEFDAVVLATPTATHAPLCLAAMRAGKHVLLEKPLSPTLAEGRELLAAEKECRVLVQIGYEVRSSQWLKRLCALRRDGRLGEVVFVWWHMFLESAPHGWRAERKLCGGKLFDCCCHYWDVMQLMVGAPVLRLSAFGNDLGCVGPDAVTVPRVATVNFEYANGAKGNMALSEVTPAPEASLAGLVGTRGIIYANPWRPEGAGSMDCHLDGGLYREQITVNGSVASRGHLGFAEQHDAFLNAILDGQPPPCSLADAFEVARIGVAIDRSLATGNTVMMRDIEA